MSVRVGHRQARPGRLDAWWRATADRKGLTLRFSCRVVMAAGAAIAGTVALALGSSVVSVAVVAAAGAIVPPAALVAWPDQRAARLDAQVPALLDAVARSLRSGCSLLRAFTDAAIEVPAPLGVEARAVALRVEAGVAFADALRAASGNASAPGFRTALVAVALAHDAGGPQAMVLDSLAASLRARQAAARELRSLTTPVRVSAVLIALAPLGVLSAVAAIDPATVHAAYASSPGRLAAVAGLAFDAAGFWWIRALTRFS